eukprot:TRINITY_DN9010_c0_g1_i1.p2 TRINITY_DN9010_c0_g1~~TRINITY_DN9010_c0_g1_i1.p2  ORF type:complete len:104 (+),score=11.62 TRINITY_DN9010_c0_g1_i1:866-1177(+)
MIESCGGKIWGRRNWGLGEGRVMWSWEGRFDHGSILGHKQLKEIFTRTCKNPQEETQKKIFKSKYIFRCPLKEEFTSVYKALLEIGSRAMIVLVDSTIRMKEI